MSLLIRFPGFLGPFTLYLPLIIPRGLLLHSLSFLGPFTPSLPLFILVGLVVINPTISTYWACFPVPLLFSLSHFLYIVGLLLLLGLLSKMGINTSITPYIVHTIGIKSYKRINIWRWRAIKHYKGFLLQASSLHHRICATIHFPKNMVHLHLLEPVKHRPAIM